MNGTLLKKKAKQRNKKQRKQGKQNKSENSINEFDKWPATTSALEEPNNKRVTKVLQLETTSRVDLEVQGLGVGEQQKQAFGAFVDF